MRIAIGADHAGFELKGYLATFLREMGFQVVDVGTFSTETVDYPDFAEAVGLSLLKNQADRGILICCSGVGASVAATKLPGVRAGLCHDTYSAHQGVEHDDMNIIGVGGRVWLGLNWPKNLFGHLWRLNLTVQSATGEGWKRSAYWRCVMAIRQQI